MTAQGRRGGSQATAPPAPSPDEVPDPREPTLFDRDFGLARAGDPDTSRQAASAQHAGVIAAVLGLFERGGDWTDDELAEALKDYFYGPTVKSARSRLYRKHRLVEPTDVRRPSNRGHPQVAWRLRSPG